MSRVIETSRLTLRPWRAVDHPSASRVYGSPAVHSRLDPRLSLSTPAALRRTLVRWSAEDGRPVPEGHWAVELSEGGSSAACPSSSCRRPTGT